MRFTRVPPEGPEEIKEAVLADLEALGSGLRVVASAIPVPGRGTIDLMAADDRGRLALISFALEAGHENIGLAVSQWEWAASSLGVLRALASGLGLDLSVEPRLMLVAAKTTEAARRLAGFIERPAVEMFEATLVASGDHRGVLIERAGALMLPPAGHAAGIDPVLDGLPAGEARSLMRRILEEMRDAGVDGQPLDAVGLDGGVAIRHQGRLVGLVIAIEGGVRTIPVDDSRALNVEGDAGCRSAASLIMKAARFEARVAARGSAASVAVAGIPASSDGAGARGLAAALTPDEIAEFERISGPVEDRSRAAHSDESQKGHETRETGAVAAAQEPAGLEAMRSRFVEN